MKNSNTEYLIFNKATYEYITTYYNENTLKTLDLERCYYTVVNRVKQNQPTQTVKTRLEVNPDRNVSKGVSKSSSSTNSSYDTSLANPLNPTNVLLYANLLDDSSNNSSSYASCNNSNGSSYSDSSSSYSSSSSSDSSYSSSSCSSDSGSW